MLVLGLFFPGHPLVGLAAVGLVQRRWVGTKFIAAALILGAAVMRPPTLRSLLPRSLFGRALAILLVPIVVLQLVVGLVFFQRHYQRVTEQMTIERLGVEHAFSLVRQVGVAVEETARGPLPVTAPARVVLVSGIARPARFEEESKAAGYDVAASIAFADHHRYVAADIARIADAVRTSSAACVLTTEKDLMRLLPLRPLPFRVAVRPLHVRVEPDAFMPWLLERLSDARKASGRPGFVEAELTRGGPA